MNYLASLVAVYVEACKVECPVQDIPRRNTGQKSWTWLACTGIGRPSDTTYSVARKCRAARANDDFARLYSDVLYTCSWSSCRPSSSSSNSSSRFSEFLADIVRLIN